MQSTQNISRRELSNLKNLGLTDDEIRFLIWKKYKQQVSSKWR